MRTARIANVVLAWFCFIGTTQARSPLFINEIGAGINGDSSIQFVEVVVTDDIDKKWGPQADEAVGRMMLAFYDSRGQRTGRYVFSKDAPAGSKTVLVATQEFSTSFPSIVPDYIIPELVIPLVGKVCLRSNPDNAAQDFAHCVSYGGLKFLDQYEPHKAANLAEIPILDSLSLSRANNFSRAIPLNSDYQLLSPTPSSTQSQKEEILLVENQAGEESAPNAASLANQGETLFFKETFLGNSRTCSTCHHPEDAFALTPDKVATLDQSDPLFIHEQNINRIEVDSIGSTNPTGQGTQPSDFRLGGTISGSLGGQAKVIAGTGSIYYLVGGIDLDLANNILTDSEGNRGRITRLNLGNLNGPPINGDIYGLESSKYLRGPRALIVANADGFSQRANLRAVPSLIGTAFGRGVGHSPTLINFNGAVSNINRFNRAAVAQHLTRNLSRVEGRDFRFPTIDELGALKAFISSLAPQPFAARLVFDGSPRPVIDYDKDFSFTQSQQRGAELFRHRCRSCHRGSAGNSTFDVNTGVSSLEINQTDELPTEEIPGKEPNSRRFFTTHLLNLKDTAPYFHDNSVSTLEDVARFYLKDISDREAGAIASFIGNIRLQPFDVSERVVDLGYMDLDRGPSEPKTFTFTNNGEHSMTVSDIELHGQKFKADNQFLESGNERFHIYNFSNDFSFTSNAPPSGVLAPSESIEFEVVFDPDESIDYFAGVTARASIEFNVSHQGEVYQAGAVLEGERGGILDKDKDGYDWSEDNCPDVYNPAQRNTDGDWRGNACDYNDDDDNWLDIYDNCPLISNNQQLDFDKDGLGDMCDSDDDNDQMSDGWEILNNLNPKNPNDALSDLDGDGFNALSEHRFSSNPNKIDTDADKNGIPDSTDRRRKASKYLPVIISHLLEDS